jgi:hypothetical protein
MNASYVKRRIFIVVDSHEEDLAGALKQLLCHWGFDAEYYREKNQRERAPAKEYREYLKRALLGSDLVILLLSKEFQWSGYCQAEAGMSAMKGENPILILVPPAVTSDIIDISPALEGIDIVTANDPREYKKDHRNHFLTKLKEQVGRTLNVQLNAKHPDAEEELLSLNVEEELENVIDDYAINIPPKNLFALWDHIVDNSPASKSIIENIRKSLANLNSPTTLKLAGVSLKYSLKLITIALNGFVHENVKRNSTVDDRIREKKTLRIELFHMDGHAHILAALPDPYDRDFINENFNNTKWSSTLENWKRACDSAGIYIEVPIPRRIDYIPPRVGVLIHDINNTTLYAGRCSFKKRGDQFELVVGERQYFHYTQADEGGRLAIAEFNQYLEAYSRTIHNRGTQELEQDEWLKQVKSYIESSSDVDEIILISKCNTDFVQLIVAALRKGIHVKAYVQFPSKDMPSRSRSQVLSLETRIKDDVVNAGFEPKSTVSAYHYRHLSTFRAALIGNIALGCQPYINSNAPTHDHDTDHKKGVAGTTIPGPVCLLLTQSSPKFELYKQKWITHFLASPTIDPNPTFIFPKHVTVTAPPSQSTTTPVRDRDPTTQIKPE